MAAEAACPPGYRGQAARLTTHLTRAADCPETSRGLAENYGVTEQRHNSPWPFRQSSAISTHTPWPRMP